jgi:tetratricopeptide (TPR) repeat protein
MSVKDPQPKYFYNRGIVYDEKGAYKKAIADYTKAIQHTKASRGGPFIISDALNNRCLAYRALGQHDKAEADLIKLRSKFRGYKEAIYRRERDMNRNTPPIFWLG